MPAAASKAFCELEKRGRVDKVAAVVITSGNHFVRPQLIRGADGTARENRREPERIGIAACVARSACRTSAPSSEQPVRGTRERLKLKARARGTPKTPHRHQPLRGVFLWAEVARAA
jgi:hypothetical protein